MTNFLIFCISGSVRVQDKKLVVLLDIIIAFIFLFSNLIRQRCFG